MMQRQPYCAPPHTQAYWWRRQSDEANVYKWMIRRIWWWTEDNGQILGLQGEMAAGKITMQH